MPVKYWLGLVLALICIMAARAEAEPRIALVIGNAHYSGEFLPPLKNPVNDAKLMAETLRKVGFKVTMLADADQKTMMRALMDFGDLVANAGLGTTAAFYYAGHGVQVGAAGYMIPIGAWIEKEADVEIEAIAIEDVTQQLASTGNKVSILMLDAGRNGLSRRFRSGASGPGEPSRLHAGVFISYAASAGESAADGRGLNGPYAAAVSRAILTPGVTIDEVFRRVRAEVAAKADGRTTVDISTLDAPFYFLPQN